MIKITPDPKVLLALSAAFPKPPTAAAKALTKYIALLEQQVNTALLAGRNPEQHKLELYSVSLHDMMNRGGQIGPSKIRVHKWLKDNQLELIKTVTKGNNLTGRLSEVKLTPLVSATEQAASPVASADPDAQAATTLEDLEKQIIDENDLLYRVCPEFSQGITREVLHQIYDVLEVDVKSLSNYIYWLQHEADRMPSSKKEHALIQARYILAVAQALEGQYLQRKKRSDFGRIYYEGVSIQNINRTLRSAVLGDCWEYDIRSSVVTWKMGFAKDFLKEVQSTQTAADYFKYTLWYINNKSELMMNLRGSVFKTCSNVPVDLQDDLLNQAFTAICFGARAGSTGWKDNSGRWNNPAIVDIIKNSEERKLFLASLIVKKFIAEQNALDDFIFGKVAIYVPGLLKNPAVQTLGGKPAKAKVLAYLYQHAETQVMDIVRSTAIANQYEPLANVHDAVFFRQRLGENSKERIVWAMRDQTSNPYWDLKPSKIQRFSRSMRLHDQDEAKHKTRIKEEERKAAAAIKARNIAGNERGDLID